MFLADYHLHCAPYSPDAEPTMLQLVEGAIANGMTHICVTNHVENCSQSPAAPNQFPPFADWDRLKTEFDAVRDKLGGQLDMRLGAEVGGPHFRPDIGREIYGREMLDFIIGSIHNLRNADDFYFLTYPEDFNDFRPTVEEYLQEYVWMAKSRLCDVLGHIGYMQRYMARQGKFMDIMEFEDLLRDIFRACVENGVGIEVNTSAVRDALGRFIPDMPVLKLYKECGGEIITAGSDAHTARHAGTGIPESYELLRTCGFEYVCLFKQHKPEFVRL